MAEGEPVGVEKLPLHPGGAGQRVRAAVKRVAGDRAAGGGGVDADLVGAAGKKFYFQQGGPGPRGDDFPVGPGRTALGAHSHFLPVDGVASDRAFPRTHLAFGPTEHKSEVGFLGFPVLELAAEFAVGGVGFCGDEDSGSFQIKPVDDAGALGPSSGGKAARAVVQQGGGEGARRPAGAGMHGDPRRFVQDNDVGVLVQDVERDGFRFHVPRGGVGNSDGHGRADRKKVTWLHGLAREIHSAVFHPLLDFAAGFPAQTGEYQIRAFVSVRGSGDAVPDPFLGRKRFSARLLGMTGHVFLILPAFCSLVYAIGALFLKRSMEAGQSPRRVLVGCNLAMAICFLPLLGWARPPSTDLPVGIWLAPVACAGLFFLGQIGTFRALSGGDASVATPILGTKVIMTALIGAIFLPGGVAPKLWMGAGLGTVGVALVGFQPGGHTGRALRAVGWGLFAALVFSLTDVLVARAAKPMGFCLFGPLMMSGMAALSCTVLPVRDWFRVAEGKGIPWMLVGAGLIGLQATGLYAAIALSGDPVGVNIVYAVRGLWTVLLVAWIGRWIGNREAGLPGPVLMLRGLGAGLLFSAVWVLLRG